MFLRPPPTGDCDVVDGRQVRVGARQPDRGNDGGELGVLAELDERDVVQSPGWRFNSIKKGTEKRTEKGPESKFATSICMNSEKEPGLYRFGPIFTKEISILIQ